MLSEVISIIIICMILIAAMSLSCSSMVQMINTAKIADEVYMMNAYVWNIQFNNGKIRIDELIINNTGRIPFIVSMIYDNSGYRRLNILLLPGQAVRVDVPYSDVLVEICSVDFKVCKYIVAKVNLVYAPVPLVER